MLLQTHFGKYKETKAVGEEKVINIHNPVTQRTAVNILLYFFPIFLLFKKTKQTSDQADIANVLLLFLIHVILNHFPMLFEMCKQAI